MFEGPFYSMWSMNELKGLFLCYCEDGSSLRLVDIGEGSKLRSTLINKSQKDSLKKKCNGVIKFGQLLTPKLSKAARKAIVSDIKKYYSVKEFKTKC